MQEKEFYPKIIVIDGTPLSKVGNMGILKCHLLNNWPQNKIAHIVTSGIIDLDSIAMNQFIITKLGILCGNSGHEITTNPKTQSISKNAIRNSEKSNFNRYINFIKVFLFKNLYRIYKPLTHIYRYSDRLYSRKLKSFVERLNPDVILTFAVTLPELKAAYLISKRHNIPLVIYIPDDYITWTYKDNFFSSFLRREFNKYFILSLKSAKLRLTIGSKMANEYNKRYDLSFLTIMDSIDVSYYQNRQKRQNINSFEFYYIGSLEPSRYENLIQLSYSIQNINTNYMKNIKLKIFGFENDKLKYAKKFKPFSFVEFCNTVSQMEVPRLQMNADALVFVESFDNFVSSSMTKYSISTKLSQYLTSGTPIFAIGPSDIASIEYLSSFNSAKIVDTCDISVLEHEVHEFVNNIEQYRKKSDAIRNFALKNFSIEETSKNFHNAILSVL